MLLSYLTAGEVYVNCLHKSFNLKLNEEYLFKLEFQTPVRPLTTQKLR